MLRLQDIHTDIRGLSSVQFHATQMPFQEIYQR